MNETNEEMMKGIKRAESKGNLIVERTGNKINFYERKRNSDGESTNEKGHLLTAWEQQDDTTWKMTALGCFAA